MGTGPKMASLDQSSSTIKPLTSKNKVVFNQHDQYVGLILGGDQTPILAITTGFGRQ